MRRSALLAQIAVPLLLLGLYLGLWHQQLRAGEIGEEATIKPALIKVKPTGYEPRAVTRESEEGEELFKALNCMACHSIHGVGGDLGPVLDAVGGRRSEEFILAHLSKADDQVEKFAKLTDKRPAELVHVRVSPDSARRLTAYLLTLPEPAGGFVIQPHAVRRPAEPAEIKPGFKPAPRTAASAEGEKLYNKLGCVACHTISKIGGWFGPQLDGVGSRRSRAYIVDHISAAHVTAGKPEAAEFKMPKLDVTAAEVQQIADYLLTLPNPK